VLGLRVYGVDDFGTFDSAIPGGSYDAIPTSDIFSLLLAHRYRYLPSHETRSILELEYEQAIKLKKRVLAFVIKDEASWPVDKIDLDKGAREAFRACRALLLERHTVAFFGSPDELAQQIEIATSHYLRKIEAIPTEPRLQQRLHPHEPQPLSPLP
jgi:hypothetical protein